MKSKITGMMLIPLILALAAPCNASEAEEEAKSVDGAAIPSKKNSLAQEDQPQIEVSDESLLTDDLDMSDLELEEELFAGPLQAELDQKIKELDLKSKELDLKSKKIDLKSKEIDLESEERQKLYQEILDNGRS